MGAPGPVVLDPRACQGAVVLEHLLILFAGEVNDSAGIKRRDCHIPGCGEDLLGFFYEGFDVIFGAWLGASAVAFVDASVHSDELGLLRYIGLTVESGGYIRQRADGYNLDGAGRIRNRIDYRLDTVGVNLARIRRKVVVFGPCVLPPFALVLTDADTDRYIRSADRLEKFGNSPGL